ncbi:MAG: phasin family protein [Hyphomicrobiaceae bacterium]
MYGVGNGMFDQNALASWAKNCQTESQALTKSFTPATEALTLAYSDSVRLMSKRARAYIELPGALAACKTPQDLVAAQQSFWQTCVHDYMAAANTAFAYLSAVSPVTGVEETLEDESIQSCPETRDELPLRANGASTAETRKRPLDETGQWQKQAPAA